MLTIATDDPADPRLSDYVSLRDSQLRRSLEAERGLFIAEGDKIIRRAVEAGYRPRSFLLAPRWLAGLADVVERGDAPVYVVPEAVTERLTGFHVHRGALAALERGEGRAASSLFGARRLVVCQDIVDHHNLGAIIRDAAALGWDGVLVSAGSADPLYRRAIKGSMGTVFAEPWARLAPGEGPGTLRDAGLIGVALVADASARPIDDVAGDLTGSRIALLVGSEGPGLTPDWVEAADVRATIPMRAGVDSLNVAAATAIACHLLR